MEKELEQHAPPPKAAPKAKPGRPAGRTNTHVLWTPEEDNIIDMAVRMQGLTWKAIAKLLPGRTESGCRNRWVRNQERAFAAAGMTVQGAAAVFAALNASRAAAGQPAHATIQAEQPVGEAGGAEGEEYGEDGAEAEGEVPLAESAVQLDPTQKM